MHRRIELDSIVAKIGREPLWEYVEYRMEEEFKEIGFDYTQVIEKPTAAVLYPNAVADFLAKLDTYLETITEDEWRAITEDELSGVKELIEVADKEEECTSRLEDVVASDEVIQKTVIPKVEKLMDELADAIT